MQLIRNIADLSIFAYWWSLVVSLACIYNLLVLPMMIFEEFYKNYYIVWLLVNVLADLINIGDIGFKVYTDPSIKTTGEHAKRYVRSREFFVDVLAVLPTDLILLELPRVSLFRLNRLLKMYRVTHFIAQSEIHTNYPHLVQLCRLSFTCFVIFHWNCCVYFCLSIYYNFEEATIDDWTFSYAKIPDLQYALCDTRFIVPANACLFDESVRNARRRNLYINELRTHWLDKGFNTTMFSKWAKKYQQSFYWSALTLVKLGEQPWPNNSVESVFEVCDTLFGLLIFAVIIGDIGHMVSQLNGSKTRYETFMDNCRRYIQIRKVDRRLNQRITNWFRYYWNECHAELDEKEIYKYLPLALRQELAKEIHIDTLRKIPLFKDCTEKLLHEIIANFRLRIYSPGDYICHKGDVGKELYVVKRGELEIINERNGEVYDYLKEGSVFGEFSLLNIAKYGNRRTASVRAVGFVDVYVLEKRDLWKSINNYPTAKKQLIDRGKEILCRDYLLDADTLDFTDDDDEFDDNLTSDERIRRICVRVQRLKRSVDEFDTTFVENNNRLKVRFSVVEAEYRRQRLALNSLL